MAYGLAGSLELSAYKRLATRAEIQSFALNILVGLGDRRHHPGIAQDGKGLFLASSRA